MVSVNHIAAVKRTRVISGCESRTNHLAAALGCSTWLQGDCESSNRGTAFPPAPRAWRRSSEPGARPDKRHTTRRVLNEIGRGLGPGRDRRHELMPNPPHRLARAHRFM